MINLNILGEQKIIGDFYDADENLLLKDTKGLIKFNRYYIDDSYAIFYSYIPLYSHDDLIFITNNNEKIILRHRSENLDSITYKILELKINSDKSSKKNIYTSGCVDDLVYFDKKIELDDFIITKKNVLETHKKGTFSAYYEIFSEEPVSLTFINSIFLMLSTITGTKFFCISKQTDNSSVTFYNKFSRNRKITIYGSGKLLFPIELNELDTIRKKINPKFFNIVLHLYTRFCTTSDLLSRLINGCGLFDYLIETYIESNGYNSLGRGKTKQLYNLIDKVTQTQPSYRDYISFMFKKYPESSKKINGKFEFWELRDQFVHRGLLLLNKSQILKITHNVFVVNEILRILILNLDKINYKVLKDKPIIPVICMEDSIKYRRKNISEEW